MNTKIVALLLASVMLIGMTGLVVATTSEKTLQWDVATDTTFTVHFEASETSFDFTCSSQNETLVEPDSQNAAGTTPICTIENTGNSILHMTCNLSTSKPSWATLKVGNESTYADADTFDTTAVTINATVRVAESTDMYLWTNITEAVSGNTQRTIRINANTA